MLTAKVAVKRAARVMAAWLAGGLAVACAEPDRASGLSWSVTTHPRTADHYVVLFRAFLTGTDPVAARQRLFCEQGRLTGGLGVLEAARRAAAARDTLLRTTADRAAYERADAATAGQVFSGGGDVCDSLNTAADREAGPIPPAPESLRAR